MAGCLVENQRRNVPYATVRDDTNSVRPERAVVFHPQWQELTSEQTAFAREADLVRCGPCPALAPHPCFASSAICLSRMATCSSWLRCAATVLPVADVTSRDLPHSERNVIPTTGARTPDKTWASCLLLALGYRQSDHPPRNGSESFIQFSDVRLDSPKRLRHLVASGVRLDEGDATVANL